MGRQQHSEMLSLDIVAPDIVIYRIKWTYLNASLFTVACKSLALAEAMS